MIDRDRFFARIKRSLFGRNLSATSQANMNLIMDYWISRYSANPVQQLAYVLATVLGEVGYRMQPVRETFAADDATARARLAHKPYAQSMPPYGHAYYGRGYVQLTWKDNYERQGTIYGQDFIQFPDLVLQTAHALPILVEGMMAGDFNRLGKGLAYYVNADRVDYIAARRTVNVQDRAQKFADFAISFEDAIEFAQGASPIFEALGADRKGSPETIQLSDEHAAAQHDGTIWSLETQG